MNLEKYFKKTIKVELKVTKDEYEILNKLMKQGFDINEFVSEKMKSEIITLCDIYNNNSGESNE